MVMVTMTATTTTIITGTIRVAGGRLNRRSAEAEFVTVCTGVRVIQIRAPLTVRFYILIFAFAQPRTRRAAAVLGRLAAMSGRLLKFDMFTPMTESSLGLRQLRGTPRRRSAEPDILYG